MSQSPALSSPTSVTVGGFGWVFPWIKIWLPVLACLPLSIIFMVGLLNRPDYEFFPLHMGAVAFLMFIRSQNLGTLEPKDNPKLNLAFWVWWLAVLGCSIMALERLSFLLGIGGLFLVTARIGGRKLLAAWWPCALLLLWMVPPPLGILDWVVQSLQGIAVRASHRLLMLMDVLHGIQGNTIYLPTQSLFVSEACSGVRSLVTLGAFASIWSLFLGRGWIHGTLLVGLSLGWVLVLNALRIVVITWAATRDIDLLNGWPHTAIGLVMFALGVGLIGSTDALLSLIRSVVRTLLPERQKPPGRLGVFQAPSLEELTRWPSVDSTGWGPIRGKALVTVLVIQLLATGLTVFHNQVQWRAAQHLPLLEGVLPTDIAGWKNEIGPKKAQSTNMFSMDVESQQWVFRKGSAVAVVSLDDHFRGWHPLWVCYEFTGWNRLATWEDEGAGGIRHQVLYQKSLDQNGYLVFGLYSQNHEWIRRPHPFLRYYYALTNHLESVWLGKAGTIAEPLTQQVQVFVESPFPLNDSGRQDVLRLFEGVREILEPRLWPEGK